MSLDRYKIFMLKAPYRQRKLCSLARVHVFPAARFAVELA